MGWRVNEASYRHHSVVREQRGLSRATKMNAFGRAFFPEKLDASGLLMNGIDFSLNRSSTFPLGIISGDIAYLDFVRNFCED